MERNDVAKAIGSRIQLAHRQPKNLKKIVGGARVGQVGASTFPPTQVVPNVGSAESCVQNWWRQRFLKVQQHRNSTLLDRVLILKVIGSFIWGPASNVRGSM